VKKPVSKFAFQVHNLQRYSVAASAAAPGASTPGRDASGAKNGDGDSEDGDGSGKKKKKINFWTLQNSKVMIKACFGYGVAAHVESS
jgi:hypothetical protein